MGIFGRVKSWFKKEEPKNAQEYYDKHITKPVDNDAIVQHMREQQAAADESAARVFDAILNEQQTFEYQARHRTAEETEEIKAQIQERPPQEPLPQSKPVAEPRIPLNRQTNIRARKLLERRKNLRELSKIRPNGTEVVPDA